MQIVFIIEQWILHTFRDGFTCCKMNDAVNAVIFEECSNGILLRRSNFQIRVVPEIRVMPLKTETSALERSSIITTSKPASCNATTVWDPMYPSPPVTKIFCMGIKRLRFYKIDYRFAMYAICSSSNSRMHRKWNYLLNQLVGNWKITFTITLVPIGLLGMQWNGIVHSRRNSFFVEVCCQCIPVDSLHAEGILMKHMAIAARKECFGWTVPCWGDNLINPQSLCIFFVQPIS